MAIEVVAEVIEPEHIDLVPAVIDSQAYLAKRQSWLESMMEPYRDMDDEAIAKMDVKEAKACHADLNRIIKEVDDERKLIKAEYERPLKEFEAEVANLLTPAKGAKLKLKEYIDAHTEKEREFIRQGLERTYEDFAPILVPVVPFERILEINPKWLNKSYGAAKAATELEDAVEKIAKDWEVLKRARSLMRFYDEAEAVFFRTLDINEAMRHNDEREEEQRRIDEMKAEQAALAVERTEEALSGDGRKHYSFSVWLDDNELASLREWKTACSIGREWRFRKNG